MPRYWIVVTRRQWQSRKIQEQTGTRKLFIRRLRTYTLVASGNSELYSTEDNSAWSVDNVILGCTEHMVTEDYSKKASYMAFLIYAYNMLIWCGKPFNLN